MLMLLTGIGAVSASPKAADRSLRECVRQAASPAEISACEHTAGNALQQRITTLNEHIRKQLRDNDRRVFEQNVKAWTTFVALNQLLEQRVDQLVAYLQTLKR